jgi:hypothetical protein
MKKILLLLLIVAGASRLKAQQHSNTIDSMLFKAPKNFNQFKLSDSSLFKNFNLPKQNQLTVLSSSNKLNIEPFYSRMPVVKVSSNDKMPVARGANVDNMPVLKIKVVDPLVVVKPINP